MSVQPPGELMVRAARREDAGALLACARAFHAEDEHPLDRSGEAALVALADPASPHGRIFVLEQDGAIVGYVALCFGFSIEYGGRDAFIDDLYVAPSFRGRGCAARLYAAAHDEALAAGCRALHLEVMPGNATEAWYHRLGFRDRGSKMMSKRMPEGSPRSLGD